MWIPNFRSLHGTQVSFNKALFQKLNKAWLTEESCVIRETWKKDINLPLFNAFRPLRESYYSYPASQSMLISYNPNAIYEVKKALTCFI